MQRTTPLHEHPEFCIIQHSGWREYRVDAPGMRRRGASKIPSFGGLWFDACLALALAYYWSVIVAALPRLAASAAVILLYLYSRLTRVLIRGHNPMLGIQLETHRGVAGYSLLASRKVPLQLEVAFQNILPRFPVLLEVYHGVQEALQDEAENEHASDT
ncbi:hypothetical protein C8T65DRAFT_93908 [Cerioporus squamosus]|nr:hypothetical protein C8T65DRAFT_93908 [Cerioporus squamosus]